MKTKQMYVCDACGAEFTKWQGQCTACQAWNTLKAITVAPKASKSTSVQAQFQGYTGQTDATIQRLDDVSLEETPRIPTHVDELDRVLGGGLVPGSVLIIGGHPGAGKSTLLLQVFCRLAQAHNALYVTGEESLQQVAMRAKRLHLPTQQLHVLAETDVHSICQLAERSRPRMMVIDSIQVMHCANANASPGSVSQVKESAAYLTRFAKQTGTVLFIVGHVTKDGALAGPKVLEHMIDASLMLEGEHNNRYRTLRSIKNRFGAVNEIGVFAMTEQGLKEVKNPSAIFLNRSIQTAAGSVVTVLWEGTRPLLVELQALVDQGGSGHARRVTVGVDQNRLVMLLAVMHRHGAIQASDLDVFVNVVGGIKITETSADLAVILACVSSLKNKPLPKGLLVFGEIGLTGEMRPVANGQERLHEAAKHGFTQAIIPASNQPKTSINGIKVYPVETLEQAMDAYAAVVE